MAGTKSSIYKYQPLWGCWKADELIAENSFGETYRVYREEWGRRFVSAVSITTVIVGDRHIKAAQAIGIDDASMEEYLKSHVNIIMNEIESIYRLKGNPNIVAYEDHAIFEKKGKLGWDVLIRTELLQPLSQYIQVSELTRNDIVRLGIDICKALEACEKESIVHGDIRDANIFVSEKGEFKLGNFCMREFRGNGIALAAPNSYLYMAPEIYKEFNFDFTVDTYSLGMVMYKLLNKGRHPFLPETAKPISAADAANSLLYRINGSEFPLPADADETLGRIILKACSFNQKDRFKSPFEFRQKLERLIKQESRMCRNAKSEQESTVECIAAASETARLDFFAAEAANSTGELEKEAITKKDEQPIIKNDIRKRILLVVAACLAASVLILAISTYKGAANKKTYAEAVVGGTKTVHSSIEDKSVQASLGITKTASENELQELEEKSNAITSTAANQVVQTTGKSSRGKGKSTRKSAAADNYQKAVECYNSGNYQAAINMFKELVKVEPAYNKSQQFADSFSKLAYDHNLTGVRCYEEGRLIEAVKEFESAINTMADMKVYTQGYDAVLCAKWTDLYQKNKSEVTRKINKIDEYMKLADTRNREGVRLYFDGKLSAAKAEFEAAIKYMKDVKTLVPGYNSKVYSSALEDYYDNLNRIK